MRPFFRKPWVTRADADRFALALPDGLEVILTQLGGELRELLATDSDVVRRVFPTAYVDDPDREEGYQALIRGELIDRHQRGIDLIAATVDHDTLTGEQLSSWMTTINAIRLILGTALAVDEEHDLDLDEDDPRLPVHQLFEMLGVLLRDIVEAFGDPA